MFLVAAVVTAVTLPLGSALADGTNYGGALDPNFGKGGVISTRITSLGAGSGDFSMVAVQPSGKILLGGWLGGVGAVQGPGVIMRFTAQGSLDTTFGTNGRISLPWWESPR